MSVADAIPLAAARPGVWRRLTATPAVLVALVFLSLTVLVGLSVPLLPLLDPDVTNLAIRLQPALSLDHLLGTDQVGRDLLSRLLWGMRTSLLVGLGAAVLSAAIGSLIGVAAAFGGRWTDAVLMRAVEVAMAFPYLLLALAIVAALGPNLLHAMIAVVVINAPFFARAVRGATLSLVHADFVAAARLSGRSQFGIVFVELFPNVLPVLAVAWTATAGWMLLEMAGLSFLGLGAQPPQAELGAMLGEARGLLTVAPHAPLFPALLIFLLAVGLNVVGNGVRDVLDPRLSTSTAAPMVHSATVVSGQRTPVAGSADHDLLSVEGLATHFDLGGRVERAVDGVSFTVKFGQTLGIVGESGSGKTVTALSIPRLVTSPPGFIARGEVRLAGESLLDASPRRLQEIRGGSIGFVFQDPLGSLNPLLTVGDQVAEAVRAGTSADRRKHAHQLLQSLGIRGEVGRSDAYPHELSGGERQRVAIAIAVANDPQLLIADEPTTALDAKTEGAALELLSAMRRRRLVAIILISHDIALVRRLCDAVVVMQRGRVVEAGPVALLNAPTHPYTRSLVDAARALSLR